MVFAFFGGEVGELAEEVFGVDEGDVVGEYGYEVGVDLVDGAFGIF